MVDLKNQRRMAADLLKCGVNRVWIDTNRTEDVAEAVTRTDVRSLIKEGVIKPKHKRGISRARIRHIQEQKHKGKRKGQGSRKGTKHSRLSKKRRWIQTIRPMRRTLREYRDQGQITAATYRKFYRHAKGGMFKSKAHLNAQLEGQNAFMETPEVRPKKPVEARRASAPPKKAVPKPKPPKKKPAKEPKAKKAKKESPKKAKKEPKSSKAVKSAKKK
jgi:large subunit ribosomal protein L19e